LTKGADDDQECCAIFKKRGATNIISFIFTSNSSNEPHENNKACIDLNSFRFI